MTQEPNETSIKILDETTDRASNENPHRRGRPPKYKPGDRFGSFTLISRVDGFNAGNPRWRCQCKCGKIKTIYLSNLIIGKSVVCGCIDPELPYFPGHHFGQFKLLTEEEKLQATCGHFIDKTKSPTQSRWLCRCDCGHRALIEPVHLITGSVTSCGRCSRRFGLPKRLYSDKKVFGNLILVDSISGSSDQIRCKCLCGNEKIVSKSELYEDQVTDCGCGLDPRRFLKQNPRFGKRFIYRYRGQNIAADPLYLCQCDCGRWLTASLDKIVLGEPICSCEM